MRAWDLLDSWPAAVTLTLLLHGAVASWPYHPGSDDEELEFVDFELAEVPEPTPPPPPPPPPQPEPPGPKNPDPAAAPHKTSAVSNRPDDAVPDEEVRLRTGLALDPSQLVEGGLDVRVGNTNTPGFDADVAPGDLQGFEGGGAGGGDLAGTASAPPDQRAELLRSFQPRYPEHLVNAHIEGRVVLRVEVLTNGRAGRVELVQRVHPDLDRIAVEAMERFRWRPARRDGERVVTHAQIAIRFIIQEGSGSQM